MQLLQTRKLRLSVSCNQSLVAVCYVARHVTNGTNNLDQQLTIEHTAA
jgi:hypothetical protein